MANSKATRNSQSVNRLNDLKTINNVSLDGPGNINIVGSDGAGWSFVDAPSYNLTTGDMISVSATDSIVDIHQPDVITQGDFVMIHNSVDSLYDIRLLNPTRTIRGATKSITGDNLLIERGVTVHLLASSPTQWEVI